jgi:hypothetical protein
MGRAKHHAGGGPGTQYLQHKYMNNFNNQDLEEESVA